MMAAEDPKCPKCGATLGIRFLNNCVEGKYQQHTCPECGFREDIPGWTHEHPDAD